jgi:hypothetical protein
MRGRPKKKKGEVKEDEAEVPKRDFSEQSSHINMHAWKSNINGRHVWVIGN